MPNPRRNRERKPARRSPFREPRPTILIVCEGQETEPQYFAGFRQACHNPRVDIEIASEHGIPRTLVETAKERKRTAEQNAKREGDENLAYDLVWCVFDVNDHPDVGDAQQMAKDNGIHLAISNPCFELWLLLHFRDSPGMQHRAKLHKLLRVHVPQYNKHIQYAAFEGGYQQAVLRATQMEESARAANEEGRNPATNVYQLTELIRR